MKRLSVVVLLALCHSGASTFAQVRFQNLDFEQAQLVFASYPSEVYTSSALPYWTAAINGNPEWADRAFYNTISGGAAFVSIHDSLSYWKPLSGNYSVMLQGRLPERDEVSISQTGFIPANAKSLQFLAMAYPDHAVGNLLVTLGGKQVPIMRLGDPGPSYSTWGADISEFAGQQLELKFSMRQHFVGPMLDDITFSPLEIPEPRAWALLFFASSLSLLMRRRRRAR